MIKQPIELPDPASFRDPDATIYLKAGSVYRHIYPSYQKHYDHLMHSGLYQRLVDKRLLIPHIEVTSSPTKDTYRILKPQHVPLITYPYEWCFSQLQESALVTLAIQKEALAKGMSLKDASAYNIQLVEGVPTLIDTSSFELYQEGEPWVAYRQFCQHFVAPLALAAYSDLRLLRILATYTDGVPLDLASKLLPRRTWIKFGLVAHIHAHAASQRRYKSSAKKSTGRLSRHALLGMIGNLESLINNLTLPGQSTEWGKYYEKTSYSETAMDQKESVVEKMLRAIKPKNIVDLGANDGRFSRIAASLGSFVVSLDIDPVAVNNNYRAMRQHAEQTVVPLLNDLMNPSPGIGWNNQERPALLQRLHPDCTIALALMHHLAIGQNIPLLQLAQFLQGLSPHVIIEFVPKSDSQVKRLLATRKDIFPHYTQEHFEQQFSRFFSIEERVTIKGSNRTIYRMKRSPHA